MRNSFLFLIVFALFLTAIVVGRKVTPEETEKRAESLVVPHIGSIEILNGCGIEEVARRAADLLRKKGFDVKNDGIGNAETFNYPHTMVISRIKDMSIARRIGRELGLDDDKVLLIRNPGNRFDVTVILGHDIERKLP